MKIDDNVKTTHGPAITLGQKVRVTDPGYDLDVSSTGILDNVKAGVYNTLMREYQTDWGIRVGTVEIWHEDTDPNYDHLTELSFVVDIDSGKAGFIDDEHFTSIWENGKHRDFYHDKCYTFEKVEIPLTDEEMEKVQKRKRLMNEYLDIEFLVLYKGKNDPKLEERATELAKQIVEIDTDLRDNHDIPFISHITINDTIPRSRNRIVTPDDKAVFASSGYGDGTYSCYVKYDDKGCIVGALIDFLDIIDDTPDV